MEQKKEFTGLFIPKHIIEDEQLSKTEMIIYAEISCFEICYKSNETLGERWGIKARRISQIISKLEKKGYVRRESFDGRNRQLVALRDKPIARQTSKKVLGRVAQNCVADKHKIATIDNNKDNIIDNNNNSKQSLPINEILDEFYEINPTLNFGNKNQRLAVEELIKKFGSDKLKAMILQYKDMMSDKFCPIATTPIAFKNKLGDIIAFFNKKQSDTIGGRII
jgi:DNA-binding MarR family transcriptional regulator